MDLNYEILQYYAYKKIIRRRQMKSIYEDCTRLHMPIETYMTAKGYCTQVTALAAMGEFFCMPYCEMGLLEVDRSLLQNVTFAFLRKHKFIPVSVDKKGVLLVAVARPLDVSAMSMVSQIPFKSIYSSIPAWRCSLRRMPCRICRKIVTGS